MNSLQLTESQKYLYMEEIAIQSMLGCLQYNNLCKLLNDPELRHTRLLWGHLQSFLGNCAMVSKYLDPARDDSELTKARKLTLSNEFVVNEESKRIFRVARNNVEHLDERIDTWVKNDNQHIIEGVFESRSNFDYFFSQHKAIRRVLIEEEMVFISEDRDGRPVEVNLKLLISELEKIHDVANKWCAQYQANKKLR